MSILWSTTDCEALNIPAFMAIPTMVSGQLPWPFSMWPKSERIC